MNKSESIKELAAALSKAQAELPAVQFDAVNPFLKNKYASLGAIIAAARPVLAKNGLAIAQPTVSDGDQVGVTTILMHSSGEYIAETFTMPTGEERGKSSAQVAGSVITYLRRYGLASMLGMYADEDGDGNSHEPKPTQAAKPKSNGQVSDEVYGVQKMTLETAINVTGHDGAKYGDIETKKLASMINSMQAVLDGKRENKAGYSDEEYQFRIDAAKTIIANRTETA